MSYTPTEWKTGDIVTAQKLNKIETGIGGNHIEIINVVNDNGTMTKDKTFNEIFEIIQNGNLPILRAVAHFSSAPYDTITYFYPSGFQSDYSANVGGGSLLFYAFIPQLWSATTLNGIQATELSINRDETITLKTGSKTLA